MEQSALETNPGRTEGSDKIADTAERVLGGTVLDVTAFKIKVIPRRLGVETAIGGEYCSPDESPTTNLSKECFANISKRKK